MTGTGVHRQRIRFALSNLRSDNGQFAFERLCLELARATISRNVRPATGPVSAGGDQGRDFETFPTSLPGEVRDVGTELGICDGDAIAFVCTLQQRNARSKLLADVAKIAATGEPVAAIVAYCEASIPVGLRHRIEQEVRTRHNVQLTVFDGDAIADLLVSRESELSSVIAECLRVTPERAGVPEPRHLPRGPLRFVNREREIAALDGIAREAASAPGPKVAVLAGMHGVGKSAVGSAWANRNRQRFVGGDLFGDFSRRRQGGAVDVSEVLADFLRDLGTPDVAIPSGLGDRQRLFHRLTTDRKLLMLLDDVDQAAQVLPVLPAGAGSVVVVTTNYHLEELLWEGAELVQLEPLDVETSTRLLEEIVGHPRVHAEHGASKELIELCGGLPIVLCVCGGRLAAHPTRTIRWLVERVKSTPHRLAALSGTGTFALDAVFDFTYRDLAPVTARVYRRLGLHPGPDIVVPAAATLADVPVADALSLLEGLRSAHLIEMPEPNRYRFHDLVRDHALSCAERFDNEPARDTAVERLIDWYYAAVRAADLSVVADRLRLTDHLEVPAEGIPSFPTAQTAFEWFAAERANVMAVVRAAFEREFDDRVWHFAEALWPLCASHKHFAEWIESHQLAIESSVRIGDRCAEARVRSQLARAYAELNESRRAREQLLGAREAAAACGNGLLEASVIEFGGVCDLRLGAPAEALAAFRVARHQFAATRSARGVALQDLYAGSALLQLGRHADALSTLDGAEVGLRAVGDYISVARVLVRRGEALRHLGQHERAEGALRDAVEIMDEFGIRFEQAEAFEQLASLADDAAQRDTARRHRQRAYHIYSELGHPRADDLFLLLNQSA